MTPKALFIFLGTAFTLWTIALACETGGGAIGRLTTGTTLDATNTDASTNFFLASGTVSRTADLGFSTITIDSTAGDVVLDMGAHDLVMGASGRAILVSGDNDVSITGSGKFSSQLVLCLHNYSSGTFTFGLDTRSDGDSRLAVGGTGLTVWTGPSVWRRRPRLAAVMERAPAVGRPHRGASTALLGLGLIQIAIAIGTGIDFLLSRSVGFFRFPHLVSSSAQPTEHRHHLVDFGLSILALGFVQRLANNQNVLYRGALQGRASRNLEVASPVRIGRLPVTLGDVQRYRLTGAQPLVTRRAMNALQRRGFLVDPGDVSDRQAIDVQSLVSECHSFRFR